MSYNPVKKKDEQKFRVPVITYQLEKSTLEQTVYLGYCENFNTYFGTLRF